jgi:hypothetical protein
MTTLDCHCYPYPPPPPPPLSTSIHPLHHHDKHDLYRSTLHHPRFPCRSDSYPADRSKRSMSPGIWNSCRRFSRHPGRLQQLKRAVCSIHRSAVGHHCRKQRRRPALRYHPVSRRSGQPRDRQGDGVSHQLCSFINNKHTDTIPLLSSNSVYPCIANAPQTWYLTDDNRMQVFASFVLLHIRSIAHPYALQCHHRRNPMLER